MVFIKLFSETVAKFSPEITLYTDGSYYEGATSFAVVRQFSTNFNTIKQSLLPFNSGVFHADLAAIHSAVKYATIYKRKT